MSVPLFDFKLELGQQFTHKINIIIVSKEWITDKVGNCLFEKNNFKIVENPDMKLFIKSDEIIYFYFSKIFKDRTC